MTPLILGIIGFALYIVYDINSFTFENRILGCSFFAGSALLVISTIMMLIDAIRQKAFSGTADILLIILSVLLPQNHIAYNKKIA